MNSTNIHINNVHIAVVNQPESMPIEAVQTHAVQPSEFKKTPHVEVELVVRFSAGVFDWDSSAFRKFHFVVNDIGGQEIAKASSGHCTRYKPVNLPIFSGLFGLQARKCIQYDYNEYLVFPKFKIDKPGVYKYTILQTSKSDKHWQCDESQLPVRVTVKDMNSKPIIEYPYGQPQLINHLK